MNDKVKQEVGALIKELNLGCSVEDFKDKLRSEQLALSGKYLSGFCTLSEDFIREFQNELCWRNISSHQDISVDFIIEFKHKIWLLNIYHRQDLGLGLIKKFLEVDSIYG